MARFVSLFRGINVGGNHPVRMDELKALLESLGLRDVATYIQSGNVVFSGEDIDLAQLPAQIEERFAQRFGFQARVIVRSAAELSEIIANNPFQGQPEKESKWTVVLFLSSPPGSAALEELRQAYTGPEEYYLIGQELYIYYPNGQGRSKLTNTLLEKKLKTSGTARNWNTVLQLQKMLQ
ncbi:MAG TPA: DUF1697 domain-containing protein [Ktedonobacteraceae bacterium]|jgi:uncharacterized protein (DUF1697 family)|nr:DUF1697 domain-containing protein [Ktedonobacteraceae bacterium]